MRLLLAVVIALAPVVAEAQSRRRPEPAQPPASTLPPIGLPLGPIGLTLPPIGLPLPPIGLAPPGTRTESAPTPPMRGRLPRHPHGRGRSGPGVIYVVPAYPWGLTGPASAAGAETVEPAPLPLPVPPAGTLSLEVEPPTAEVYVDGYFVGTADDRRGEVRLEPGPHRVDLRAEGYLSATVDIRAESGATVSLRRTLTPLAPPDKPPTATAPPAPIPRKPFYFIPGCYLGDVPPTKAGLPAGCDPSKAVVVQNQ